MRSNGPRRWRARGAGEILLTSMDRDGTRSGFDLELTRAVSEAVTCRSSRAAASARLEHSPRASSRATPTRCSRRASSTTARSPCREAKRFIAARGHRDAAVSDATGSTSVAWNARRPGAGGRAGRGLGRGADGRVDEPRGAARAPRETGEAHYWSRSRRRCGARARNRATCSGCVEIRLDCDDDVVLLQRRAVRRHRLPHRAAALLLPRLEGEGGARAGSTTDPRARRTRRTLRAMS